MLASVALSPELLKQGKRTRGDHLHQGSVQLMPRPLLATRTITVKDFVEKEGERQGANEDYRHIPDNHRLAEITRSRAQMRTICA